jgi:hypothetical protein
MIVHKAKTETNKLTSFERLRRHYVSENYGIVAAVFAVDNANSSVRIKGLYDALHVGPAFAIVPSLLYPYIRHHLSAVVHFPDNGSVFSAKGGLTCFCRGANLSEL